MTGHNRLAPTCQWVGTRTQHPDLWPGDKVTLCTAQRIWTVGSDHDDDTVTLTSDVPDLRVHRAHLEPVDDGTDDHTEVDGQLTIYDALGDSQ